MVGAIEHLIDHLRIEDVGDDQRAQRALGIVRLLVRGEHRDERSVRIENPRLDVPREIGIDQIERVPVVRRSVQCPSADDAQAVQICRPLEERAPLERRTSSVEKLARGDERIVHGEIGDQWEGHLAGEPERNEPLGESALMLHHRIGILRQLGEVAPILTPLIREEHRAPDGDPVGLDMVGQVSGLGERIRLETRMVGQPPEVDILPVHPVEDIVEGTHRAVPGVIREHDLVELRDSVGHLLETELVAPDVEAAVLAFDDLVAHRVQFLPPGSGELPIHHGDDVLVLTS